MTTRPCAMLMASVLLGGWGCTFVAPAVPVQGTPAALELLSGEWWGEYVGDREHDRRGTIAFKLIAGEDHAHGDVLMVPRDTVRPYEPYRDDESGRRTAEPVSASRVLSIRFVAAGDGFVRGALDPYWDPDRRTEATATFRGRLRGDTIEGTFTTTYADGTPATGGRWTVARKASPRVHDPASGTAGV